MMKYVLIIFGSAWIFQSCNRETVTPLSPLTPRKIEFQLYTGEDFSSETNTIRFSVFIRSGNKTILDSALAPMQIKDIPTIGHKIIFQKMVPASVAGDLAAGFNYTIDNVGNSWYTQKVTQGDENKVIAFSFK